MIAFITFKSSLVPLLEGLWSSNSWEFEVSGFRRNRTDDLGKSQLLWRTSSCDTCDTVRVSPKYHKLLAIVEDNKLVHCGNLHWVKRNSSVPATNTLIFTPSGISFQKIIRNISQKLLGFEQIELPAKLLDYYLRRNKSNIYQNKEYMSPSISPHS